MLVLEANGDGSILIALSDDSEIEIAIIELEESKPQIIISSNESLSIVQRPLGVTG